MTHDILHTSHHLLLTLLAMYTTSMAQVILHWLKIHHLPVSSHRADAVGRPANIGPSHNHVVAGLGHRQHCYCTAPLRSAHHVLRRVVVLAVWAHPIPGLELHTWAMRVVT